MDATTADAAAAPEADTDPDADPDEPATLAGATAATTTPAVPPVVVDPRVACAPGLVVAPAGPSDAPALDPLAPPARSRPA